jgi:thioredoxin-like negative regulator of GroEL
MAQPLEYRESQDDPRRRSPLLLFFVSSRSGPARRMQSVVSWLYVRERRRLRLRTVDADARPDLVASFGLAGAPALVLVKDHRVVACVEGRATGRQIDEAILPHLDA